jgi:predicted  nucleic acid-binding Zn-ribbon protein
LAEKREIEYKEEFKELNEKIKGYEALEKKLNKQLTDWELNDLNRKNDIAKLNKEIDIRNEKLERLNKKLSEL